MTEHHLATALLIIIVAASGGSQTLLKCTPQSRYDKAMYFIPLGS